MFMPAVKNDSNSEFEFPWMTPSKPFYFRKKPPPTFLLFSAALPLPFL